MKFSCVIKFSYVMQLLMAGLPWVILFLVIISLVVVK